MTPLFMAYSAAVRIGTPLIHHFARRWMIRQGQVGARRYEPVGRYELARPDGRLIWMHAASVGELNSVMTLISRLLEQDEDLTVLVTTTTVTSAAIAEKRLPERAIHQFAPVDTPAAVRRFLSHWRPDCAVLVESAIWPHQVTGVSGRGIPLMLINARLSQKSLSQWSRRPRTARFLISKFDKILCQSEATRAAIIEIGCPSDRVLTTGDMKASVAPLQVDAAEAERLQPVLSTRHVWVASSTHPGEEDQVLQAHEAVRKSEPDSLLVLVPRHPERAAEVAAVISARGQRMAQRSNGDTITPDTQVYLADTLGETGLWYHLADTVFVAGSFSDVGGHTPYEPAQFGCAILVGPNYANFDLAYGGMLDAGACLEVADASALGSAVLDLRDGAKRQALSEAARHYAAQAADVPEVVADHIRAMMPN